MILQSFRHLWGVETPLAQFLPEAKAKGYSGIETGLGNIKDQAEFSALLTGNGLKYIAQVYSRGDTVAEQLASLREQVAAAAAFTPRPVLVNAHSGRDSFSFVQALEFYRGALEIEREIGIAIAHETHRGRVFFTPWATRDVLKELPDLQITADFSHWVCVAERLLGDCEAELQLAAQHTLHVHSRVGYEEGPQVTDPRAPEFTRHLTAHEAWWDAIWAHQKSRGLEVSTFTPEFGPPGYMHTLPYTGRPVAHLPEICDWMAERQLARYAKQG